MCGIYGEIIVRSAPKATRGLYAHPTIGLRGPDSFKEYEAANVLLGHTRLAVIDLSDDSSQPMVDEELGLVISYNGCIFNYQAIRSELVKIGYSFKTSGDTEVLLKAFHAWGARKLMHRLEGMYAAAIFKVSTGDLTLLRDPLGIKPLYYGRTPNGFAFASNCIALKNIVLDGDVISPHGLIDYLCLHSITLPPQSIIKGIYKLSPGEYLNIASNGATLSCRYDPMGMLSESEGTPTEDELIQNTERLLKESTRIHLVSDVPCALMLSGGVDSSLLAASIVEANYSDKLRAYAIGFEGDSGNEFQYSDYVASRLGISCENIIISKDQLLKAIDTSIALMPEPMASHDTAAFFLLSERIKGDGFKVALSGQGADEIFQGYSWYPRFNLANNFVPQYYRVFFDRVPWSVRRDLNSLMTVERSSPMRRLLNLLRNEDPDRCVDEKIIGADGGVMLAEDPLRRVDSMAMACGLEVRVPFSTQSMLRFSCKIPRDIRLKGGGKYILKKICASYFGEEFAFRKKGYFPVPMLQHGSSFLMERFSDLLSSKSSKVSSLLSEEARIRLLSKGGRKFVVGGSELWQLIVLDQWLSYHKIRI